MFWTSILILLKPVILPPPKDRHFLHKNLCHTKKFYFWYADVLCLQKLPLLHHTLQ